MLHAELARRNEHSPGWGKHVKSYVDEGLSGKDTNRPAFRQMMQDIELGNVQAVMFTELSRLSRSLKDFLNIFEFAQKYRCDLVCLKTEIDTTSPYKSLITKILMIFAEFEREMTSRRTALNAYERSKRGLANGGVAPLGYKRMKQKKGHLFVDEKEKQIVQDIFVTYIRLQSIRETTDYIKEKYDMKTPRLKNMSSTKVYAILTNKTYIGIRVINPGNEENREEVPAVWEPIIDRETFNKVQALLQKNREKFHSRGNQRYLYYFSGLLRCGKCGEKLQGKSAYSTNKIRHFYYSHTSTCSKGGINRIDAELVHSLIFGWLEDLATDGTYYKQLQEDGKQRIADDISCVQEELQRLETEKTAIAEQIETRIQELVKTDSEIVRSSIEQSIEKLEAGRLEIDGKVSYINRYLLELESFRKNGTDLYKGLKSKIRDVLELVENQPENMDKQTRERSKAEMRRLFAFLQLQETQIKTALSGVHLKEPVSKVFAPSPPLGLGLQSQSS